MSEEQPGLRIGHREREEALRLLKVQADEGRLAPSELTERKAAVEAAKTRTELGTAFLDLPVDPPTGEGAQFTPYPPTTAHGQAMGTTPAAQHPAESAESAESDRLPTSPQVKRVGAIVMATMWPAVIVINILFGWHLWWLFLVAGFGSGWIAWAFGIGDRPNQKD